MTADRHLLFGLLALQNGLINQGQLVAAFQAWTLDKACALADHLIGRGDLDVDDRSAVEALVARHLKKHGGDVERSLAAIPAGRSTRESLARIDDPDVGGTLAHLGPSSTQRGDDADADRTASYAIGEATADGQRFRVLRAHARGGLGAVFVALDTELHREVALKQILDQHADDPTSRQRFLLEAEITGGLEHPGIVPIYGLGSYGDGRPFYAMRFIKGDSLREAIERFHSRGALLHDTGERSLALRKLLRRFTDVCNAIEYAHSRGVLHRDIKPGNSMVGKYGETLVVDWGLAKVVGTPDTSAEATLRPPSAAGSGDTLPGSAIGTPAYMSPEQAAGELHRLGPQSDVYSLGATLYGMLTGQAPFEKGEPGDVLARVQRGDFPPPRRLKPDVPRALEAICLKAMALRPEDRYADCRALAEDVERWLADEPVSAYCEPLPARLGRWGRRHRTLVTAGAATLAVGLVILALAYTRESTIRARLARSNRELDRANRRVSAANTDLLAANDRATKARAESDRRLDQAVQAIEEYYTGVSKEVLLGQTEFQALRQRLLEKPRQFYEQLAHELESAPSPDERTQFLIAKGRLGLGMISQSLGHADVARTQFTAALTLFRGLADSDAGNPEYRRGMAVCYHDLGEVLRDTGDHRGAADALGTASNLFTKLIAEKANLLENQLALSRTYNGLALMLFRTGDLSRSVDYFRKTTQLCERLSSERPEVLIYRHELAKVYTNLCFVLREMGNVPGAVEFGRKAIGIAATLVASKPREREYQRLLAGCHGNLGIVLQLAGDLPGAADSYRAAVMIDTKLAADYPNIPGYRHSLAIGYNNLGTVLQDMRDYGGAAQAFKEGIAIRSKLAAEHPEVPDYWRGLANKSINLGNALADMRDLAGAIEAYRNAIAYWSKLTADHPDVPDYRSGLARSYNGLGNVLRLAKDFPAAHDSFERAIELGTAMVASHPEVPDFQSALGFSLHMLGLNHLFRGQQDEAVKAFYSAVRHLRRAFDRAPGVPKFRMELRAAYLHLAFALRMLGRAGEAEDAVRERGALGPEGPVDLYNDACQLALCIPCANPDVQAQAFASEAMKTLRAAAAAGWRDAAQTSRDPDLAPLRDRDEFRRLLDELFDGGFPANPFAK
jgi:serine/threonine-protein kinase